MVWKSIRDKLDGNDLDLSLLNLTEIPVKDIEALPKATNIDLSNNQLTSLPSTFATSLKNITRLDLGSNKLKVLPDNIHLLQNLTHLDLYNNQLTDLPVTFCQLRKLKWLDLKGNHLNPALRKAAGDCLNRKECEAAARNVVGYLKQRYILKENERLEKLKKEQDMENARKQIDEKQAKKLKDAEKKAAKEKKKIVSADTIKSKVEANGRAPVVKVAESKPRKRERKPRKGRKSSSLGWMNWLLALFLLGALVGGVYLYTGGDFSERGLNAAYVKLVENSQILGEITVEAFRPENLKEVAQIVSKNVQQSCAAGWAVLEEYTGDLSPYTTPVIEIANEVLEWLKVKAILCYDWICNNVDWAAIWEMIRSAVKNLYEQCIFLYEELNKNEAFLSIVETIKTYAGSLLEFLNMLWVALWKQIVIAIEYIKNEGPGVLAAVKEQASGALHAAKQSFEGLIK